MTTFNTDQLEQMMEKKEMSTSNYVAMVLFLPLFAFALGVVFAPGLEVINQAPVWTKVVFAGCWFASGLLFILDRDRQLSDLGTLGISFLVLLGAMVLQGLGGGEHEVFGRAFERAARGLLIYGGLVITPVSTLMVHHEAFQKRRKLRKEGGNA